MFVKKKVTFPKKNVIIKSRFQILSNVNTIKWMETQIVET